MILLTTVIMVFALSFYAQSSAGAYICDNSGTPTNVRNAPNGKVVQTLPDFDGDYVVTQLEVKNNWWRVDPIVEIYGDGDDEYVELKGSKTGYWMHYSVLQFNIACEYENVLCQGPSSKAKPLKIVTSYLFETGLRPLEIRGEWIKATTTDKSYIGWKPIDKICYNPLTTCPKQAKKTHLPHSTASMHTTRRLCRFLCSEIY